MKKLIGLIPIAVIAAAIVGCEPQPDRQGGAAVAPPKSSNPNLNSRIQTERDHTPKLPKSGG